jgi:hypothetical protein
MNGNFYVKSTEVKRRKEQDQKNLERLDAWARKMENYLRREAELPMFLKPQAE